MTTKAAQPGGSWRNDLHLVVDATQGDWDDLGVAAALRVGVLSTLDETDDHPRGERESVGFWDPLGLRFHDLQQEGPERIPDRRMSWTSVNDYEGPYEDVREGDVRYGQTEHFSAANRSTRERDLMGRTAIPASFRKVVDSEDGRYALAQTTIPLDLGSSASPLSELDGGSGGAGGLPEGVSIFAPGTAAGSSGQSGSVTRTAPGVSVGGVTFFGGAAVAAAQNAAAAGGSAADIARAASAAARGLPPPPILDAQPGGPGSTRERPPEPDRNPGGSVAQQDHPGGYVWDGDLIGLTGTFWTCRNAADPGQYFQGSEGTPITRLALRHDAHVAMDPNLTGRIYFSNEDASQADRGSKAFKGELQFDPTRANIDTEVGLETGQWRPVVYVNAALPPSSPPPPGGSWMDPGGRKGKGDDPEDDTIPQPLPVPIGPGGPGGGGPGGGGGGPKPPKPGNDPAEPRSACKRPKGAGSGTKPPQPLATQPRGGSAEDFADTQTGIGFDPAWFGLESAGDGAGVGATQQPQDELDLFPSGFGPVSAPLAPVSNPTSQVRDYTGMGQPCANATAGRDVTQQPHGGHLGGLVQRQDGAVIDTHGHDALTPVGGGQVALGGEESKVDETPFGGGLVTGFTRQRSGGGPDDRVIPLGLPVNQNPTAGFVVEPHVERSQEEKDEATRTRVKQRREYVQQLREEAKALESKGRRIDARSKSQKANRIERAADKIERRLESRIAKRARTEAYYERKRRERAERLAAIAERNEANATRERKPFRPAPQRNLPQGAYIVDVTESADAFGSGHVLPQGVTDVSGLGGTQPRNTETVSSLLGGGIGGGAGLGRPSAAGGAGAAGFGSWNVVNTPLQYMGAPGGAATVEGQLHTVTATLRGIQRMVTGAFGGPSYLNANLGLQETTRPGRPPAGSRIGQKAYGIDGTVSRVEKPVLEIVSVLDARAGGQINATGDGVFAVKRGNFGSTITDRRPLLYLDNNVCTAGDPDGDLISTPHYDFVVDKSGKVRTPCAKIQPAGNDGNQTSTTLTALPGGMAVQPYDATGNATDAHWSFANDGGLYFDMGATAVFQDSDGSTTTTMGQATDGTLVVVGDFAVTGKVTADWVDPRGYEFDAVASRPAEFTAANHGLWVDSGTDTLYYWDGSTDTDLTSGGGGGDHDVASALTTTSTKAIALNHTTSGTAAAGFGVHMDWELEDGAGNVEVATRIATVWTDATNGAEDADFIVETMVAGSLFEWLRWDASLGALLLDATDDVTAGTINTRVGYWRGVGNGVDAPVDGFGAQWGMALQRLSGTVTNVADFEWYWSDVSASEAAVNLSVLGTGDMLTLLGGSGAVRLPNGILELADQGTLGTPATGYARIGYDKTADANRPRFVDDAGTETSLALLSDTGGGGGDHDVSDAGTTNMVDAVDLSHTTSGTPAAGFGVRQTYTLDNELGSPEEVGSIEVLWAGAVGGSTDMEFYSLANGSPTRLFYLDGSELRTVSSVDDANTNAVSIPATVEHTCSGVPAPGFGVGWQFFLENASDGFADYSAQIHAEFGTSAASGSEDVDLVFLVCRDGNWGSSLTEGMRIDADGDGAGGTDTAVLFSTGRADWAQQATSTPPTGRVRTSAPDGQVASLMLTTEDGNTGAAVVVIDAQVGASYTGSGSQASVETFTIPANLLQQDGDSLVIEWTASMDGGGGTTSAVDFQVGGTTKFTAGLGLTLSNVAVMSRVTITRTGASAAEIEARYSEFTSGSAVNDDKTYLSTLSNSWASSLALDLDVTHSGGSFTTYIRRWRVTFYPAPR